MMWKWCRFSKDMSNRWDGKVWGGANPITVQHQTAIILPLQPFMTNWMMMRKNVIWNDLGGLSFNLKPEAWNLKRAEFRCSSDFGRRRQQSTLPIENQFKRQNIVILRRFKEGHLCFYLIFKPLRLSQLSRMFSYLQFIKNSVAEGFNWCHLSQVLLSLHCRAGGVKS